MGFYCDVRTIQTGTGTGALSAVTGLASIPKALIFMAVNRNGAGVAADAIVSVGAATATTERWCITTFDDDNVATTDSAAVYHTDQCLALMSNATTVAGKLDISSFNSDGYTLTVDQAFGADTTVIVMAIGGTDITSAKAYDFNSAAGTGNTSYTTAGFQPTWNLFASVHGTVSGTVVTNSRFGLGVGSNANGAVEQWAAFMRARDAAGTSETDAGLSTARCLTTLNSSGTAALGAWTYVQEDATGLTLNRNDANGGTPRIMALSIAGGQFKIGSTAWRTDTNNNTITGLAFQPEGVLVAAKSPQTATQNSGGPSGELSLGVASGAAARAAIWFGGEDALVGDSDANVALATNRIIIDYDVTDGTTLQSDIDMTGFTSDGLTFDQITAAGAATLMGVLYLGPSAAASGNPWYYYHQQRLAQGA